LVFQIRLESHQDHSFIGQGRHTLNNKHKHGTAAALETTNTDCELYIAALYVCSLRYKQPK